MKYTIELTDSEYNMLTGFMNMINSEIQAYYFQETELKPIKIETTNVEDTNEYQIGYKVGRKDGFAYCRYNTELVDELKQVEYNKGLEDVDHAIDVLKSMTGTECAEWFEDCVGVDEVVCGFTVQRIVEITKAYEEQKKAEKESINVGDIVKFNEKCHNYDHVKSREYLVLHIFNNGVATILYDNGDTGASDISLLDKTGKHVDEVEQLLSKLKE